ncbi:MAG: hypothetical protein H6505_03300 [Calditrichaeota bacterium]|nr:hypothetical protein [Calditrichota bacterium]
MPNPTQSPLTTALNLLSEPTNLDLDELARQLELATLETAALRGLVSLYEDELRRELRSKVELAGGIPACPDPELAFTLSGEHLLSARRNASLNFNRVFSLAPLSRSAVPSNSTRVPQDLLLRAGLGTA